MYSDDELSALNEDIANVSKRVSRLERQVMMNTPKPNAVVETKPQDQVSYLNEKAKKDDNLREDARLKIQDLEYKVAEFGASFSRIKKERDEATFHGMTVTASNVELREKVGNLEIAIRRRDYRITKDADLITDLYKRINESLYGGDGEITKLRNENRMLFDGVNRLGAEITRQQDRSLALLGSLRESHTRVKNQKRSLADTNSAHDKALDRIQELEGVRRILDDRNRELTSDANLAFTYGAQLTQAKAEIAKAEDLIGSLRNQVAGLGDQLKHERQAVAELGGQLRRERGARKKLGEDLEGERAKYYISIKANQELGAENARLNVKVASALAELEDNEDN